MSHPSEDQLDHLIAEEKARPQPPLNDWRTIAARARDEGLIRETSSRGWVSSQSWMQAAAAVLLLVGGMPSAGRPSDCLAPRRTPSRCRLEMWRRHQHLLRVRHKASRPQPPRSPLSRRPRPHSIGRSKTTGEPPSSWPPTILPADQVTAPPCTQRGWWPSTRSSMRQRARCKRLRTTRS